MRTLLAVGLLSALALPAAAQETPKKAAPPAPAKAAAKPAATAAKTVPARPAAALVSDDDKALYAVGLSIWQSLAVFDLTPAEFAIVQRALADAAAHKPSPDVPLETYGPKVQELVKARQQRVADKEKVRSAEYLAKLEKEPGAVKTESGLIYFEVTPGTGEAPKPTDVVKVNYRGTLVDGTEFDSSYKRNEPAQFPVGGVIKCWTEGLQKMKVGGKAKLVCPASIAYGERGRPSIPGGATLTFDVELLEATAAAAPPAPPPGAGSMPAAPPTPPTPGPTPKP
jgi:FKBP-type peptidyl-prolyl cis-trans isomerase FkpA